MGASNKDGLGKQARPIFVVNALYMLELLSLLRCPNSKLFAKWRHCHMKYFSPMLGATLALDGLSS